MENWSSFWNWPNYIMQFIVQLLVALLVALITGRKVGQRVARDELRKVVTTFQAQISGGDMTSGITASAPVGGNQYNIVAGSENVTELLKAFKRSEESKNPSEEIHKKISELGQIAFEKMREGNWEATISAFERILQFEPGFAQVHAHLGLSYLTMGYPETSIMHSQKALAFGGDSFMCHFNLGVAYIHIGHYPKAVYQFDTAKERLPGEPSANLGKLSLFKGEALEKMLHYVRALEEVEASIEIFKECSPDDKVAGFWHEEAQRRLGPLKEKVKEEREKPPGGLWHILQKQIERGT